MITPGVNPYPESTLPVVVDAVFAASGFEGAGQYAPASTLLTPHAAGDSATCDGRRASASARGNCHSFTFEPSLNTVMPSVGWTAVLWQYPASNWGALPGLNMAPGATKVSFYARGKNGGEMVTFGAGNDNVNKTTPNATFGDTFAVQQALTLTTDWQQYSLPLDAQPYGSGGNGVLGGFSVAVAAAGTFYIDDIVWE